MSVSKYFQPHDCDIYKYLKPQGTTPNMRDFTGSIVLPHNEMEFYRKLKNVDPSVFNKVGKKSIFYSLHVMLQKFKSTVPRKWQEMNRYVFVCSPKNAGCSSQQIWAGGGYGPRLTSQFRQPTLSGAWRGRSTNQQNA